MLLLLLVLMGLLSAFPSEAATFVAASCSLTDVTKAIGHASDGDTVIIPNGSCTWESGIATSKQIILQALPLLGVAITHGAEAATLLAFTTGTKFHTRVSGIKFLAGTGTGQYMSFTGTGVPLLDNCYMEVPNFQLNRAISWLTTGGVMWNCTMESLTINGTLGSNGSGSGGLLHKSNKRWLDAATWGTLDTNGDQKLYIEDCTFINIYNFVLDFDDNSRAVVRHNTFINSQFITHGTSSLQGGREVEIYNNGFQYRPHAPNASGITSVNVNRYFWGRAGTMLFTDNTFEDITSQDWKDKPEVVFIAESLTWGAIGASCQTSYPGTHWPGQGANGSFQVSDPIYFWNNTGTLVIGTNDQPDSCGNGLSTANFFLPNRDYFVGPARPKYTKYTYPHPLRPGNDEVPPGAPTGVQITQP